MSRVYAADTPEQLKRILDAMCATIQDWDIAREGLDLAYQYSDPRARHFVPTAQTRRWFLR